MPPTDVMQHSASPADAVGPAGVAGSADADLQILHVDMDAFFAEVERLADPSLANQAVIVGGTGGRGVVASASYEARAVGVTAAMPVSQARRLCPNAIFVNPKFELYSAASRAMRKVFESFTPLIELIALDEAFLDVSGAHGLFGTSEQIAWTIRAEVKAATQLDCCVGVATNKTLAKLASQAAKPIAALPKPKPGMGVCVVPHSDQLRFLHALPVKALWGVGRVTANRLDEMGVVTVGDLAAVPVASLIAVFGQARGSHLERLALGKDNRPVEVERVAKSLGHEETFATDVVDVTVMRSKLTQLADAVAWRLRRAGVAGRAVQLKVKLADFNLLTRIKTLPDTAAPIDTAGRITDLAVALLQQLLDRMSATDLAQGVRLLGVSVSQLEAGIDLTAPGASHSGANSPAANFTSANFTGTNFTGANADSAGAASTSTDSARAASTSTDSARAASTSTDAPIAYSDPPAQLALDLNDAPRNDAPLTGGTTRGRVAGGRTTGNRAAGNRVTGSSGAGDSFAVDSRDAARLKTLKTERQLAVAVDDIRERFGGDAIGLGFGSNPSNRPSNPRSNQ